MVQVQIKEFTGPLDLLLQLIRREEMDIFDINIHKITHQYLTFLEQNPVPDLESAGDFIKLAAVLIYIKSKSLFPPEAQNLSQQPADEINHLDEEELRNSLVQKLLRVQKLQKLSGLLSRLPLLGRDVWTRGQNDKPPLAPSAVSAADTAYHTPKTNPALADIKPQPIFNLLKAYHLTQVRSGRAERPQSHPPEEENPLFLADCIQAFRPRLAKGASWPMSALIDHSLIDAEHYKMQTVVVFLSLLELSRLGVVSLYQQADFSDIMVSVVREFKELDFRSIREVKPEDTPPPAAPAE